MEIKWVNEIGDSLFWMLVDGGWWWLMVNTIFEAPNWYLKLLMQPLWEHLPISPGCDGMEMAKLRQPNKSTFTGTLDAISWHSYSFMAFDTHPSIIFTEYGLMIHSITHSSKKKWHVILNIQPLGYLKHPHTNFNQHWSPRNISTGGTGWGSSLHVHSKTSSTWHGGA